MSLGMLDESISREQLFDAINTMPIAFAIYDADEILRGCNEVYASYHKSKREDLLGQSLKEITTAMATVVKAIDGEEIDDQTTLYRLVLDKIIGLEAQVWEIETFDNRWFLASFQRNEDGSLVGTWTDISQQKSAEKEARLNQLQLEDAIEAVPDIFHCMTVITK